MRARRFLLWASLVLVCLLLVFMGFWNFIAPSMAVREMKKAMAAHCITCRIAIDHPHLGFVPGADLSFDDVSFYGGEHDHSEVQVIADAVVIAWHPLALFKHQVQLESITFVHPLVVLSEGDSPSRFKKGEKRAAKGDSDWTFEVAHTIVESATFTYHRLHDGHVGEVHASEISGAATKWGNTSEELEMAVGEAKVEGRVEHSAHAVLRVAMPVLKTEKQHIDVDLTVSNLNLGELTYFPACEGVALGGLLVSGHSQAFIRDRNSHAKTQVAYKDLEVSLKRTRKQGALDVFFTNLALDLMMRKKNLTKTPNEQTRETDGVRAEGEPIVHFILRAVKESAMKVVKT